MSGYRVAHRYAAAIIGVAEQSGQTERLSADFEFLQKMTEESRDFTSFLKSPVVNSEKKKKVLAEILQGRIGDLALKFVLLLASKGREALLPEIIPEFRRIRDDHAGVMNVTARTAVKFTDVQEKELVGRLERATKKKIHITYILDPSLKGGFMVQHDDTVWDASVRRQLERFRRQFSEGSL